MKKLAITLIVIIVATISLKGVSYLTRTKMICTSKEGSITLEYNTNTNTITKYKTKGNITYDDEEMRKAGEDYEIETYLEEYKKYFEETTGGTCRK